MTNVEPKNIPNLRHFSLKSLTGRRRSPSPLYNINLSHATTAKRLSTTESGENENNLSSHRGEGKKDCYYTPLTKILMRSSSVAPKPESKVQTVRVSVVHTETERESYVEKREKQDRKFEMWKKLTEIKELLLRNNQKEEPRMFPSRVCIRRVMECLNLLNDPDSVFNELMGLVIQTLKSAIYINPLTKDIYSKILTMTDNEDIKNLIDTLDQGIPCYSLLMAIVKDLIKQGKLKNQRNKDDVILIENLEKMISEKDELISNLNEELEVRPSLETYQQATDQVQKLTHKLDTVTQENEHLDERFRLLYSEMENLKKAYQELQEHNDLLNNKLLDSENEKHKLQQEVLDYQTRIKLAHDGLASFKNVKDKLLMKLTMVKDHIMELKQDNERLADENDILKVRAAVGFENLTPRPNYTKLSDEEKTFDKEIYHKGKRQKRFPTAQVFENLVNKMMTLIDKDENGPAKAKKGSKPGTGSKKEGDKQKPPIRSTTPLKAISNSGSNWLKPASQEQLPEKPKSLNKIQPDKPDNNNNLGTPQLTGWSPSSKKNFFITMDDKLSMKRSEADSSFNHVPTEPSHALDLPSVTAAANLMMEADLQTRRRGLIFDNDAIEITKEVMGNILEAHKAVEQLENNI